MKKSGLPVENLAINNPVKENILSLFICIFSRTSLFICGKPGSSKTLSVNWILDAFSENKKEKISNKDRFKGFSRLK
jgi:type IV secretory pathway ATPase VirB11/archaellum biosynthesis ATPase